MPSGGTSVECSSKPTAPKPSEPAPSASPAAGAAVKSPAPKDESKKKKPEKKGNGWRKRMPRFIKNPLKFSHPIKLF